MRLGQVFLCQLGDAGGFLAAWGTRDIPWCEVAFEAHHLSDSYVLKEAGTVLCSDLLRSSQQREWQILGSRKHHADSMFWAFHALGLRLDECRRVVQVWNS